MPSDAAFFVPFRTKQGEWTLFFDLSAFKGIVADFVNEHEGMRRFPVIEIHELNQLDVNEAGFMLEDAGQLKDADEVFDMRLDEFNELLSKLPCKEAA